MEINIIPDCGNAPKKLVIRDFNIAFAKRDIHKILEMVSEEIEWTIVGEKSISGKEAFREEIENMNIQKAKSLSISHIITHGKLAAAHGEMTIPTGETISFADIYEFRSAGSKEIRKLISLMIQL